MPYTHPYPPIIHQMACVRGTLHCSPYCTPTPPPPAIPPQRRHRTPNPSLQRARRCMHSPPRPPSRRRHNLRECVRGTLACRWQQGRRGLSYPDFAVAVRSVRTCVVASWWWLCREVGVVSFGRDKAGYTYLWFADADAGSGWRLWTTWR